MDPLPGPEEGNSIGVLLMFYGSYIWEEGGTKEQVLKKDLTPSLCLPSTQNVL